MEQVTGARLKLKNLENWLKFGVTNLRDLRSNTIKLSNKWTRTEYGFLSLCEKTEIKQTYSCL